MNMNDVEMMFSPPRPSTPKRRRPTYTPAAKGSASKMTGGGSRFSTPVRKPRSTAAASPSALLAGMGGNLFPGKGVRVWEAGCVVRAGTE